MLATGMEPDEEAAALDINQKLHVRSRTEAVQRFLEALEANDRAGWMDRGISYGRVESIRQTWWNDAASRALAFEKSPGLLESIGEMKIRCTPGSEPGGNVHSK